MRRIALIGALLAALFASSAATANAQWVYRRVGPVRAAVRATLPPYGYYYRPFYGRPYLGPGWGYYWW